MKTVRDNVIVKKLDEQSIVDGIILPGKGKIQKGRVVVVGPGTLVSSIDSKDTRLVPLTVSVGDIVSFDFLKSLELDNGFYLIKEADILYFEPASSDKHETCTEEISKPAEPKSPKKKIEKK